MARPKGSKNKARIVTWLVGIAMIFFLIALMFN